ncbi:SMC-Scp complex subunit ScpB [candidate division GN15 bacterium]|nr:SMC-Scp complex subunit ScpB [candidate division GN15 bacterium]
MMNEQYKHAAIEALILASPDPLPTRRITQLVEDITPSKVAEAVTVLNTKYADGGMSFRIREIAGGYQFYVLPEYVRFIEDMFSKRRRLRLSRAALEAVAIIAYRQPVTKTEVEHIRGVVSDGVIRTLLEKKLVTVTGRAETVGKPLQYGTTDEFLKFFGLASLYDLPKMSEIEQMISATESRDQTELMLEISGQGEDIKLNIADGTFVPRSDEAEVSEAEVSEAEGVASAGPQVAANAEIEAPADPGRFRLVLKKSTETVAPEAVSSDTTALQESGDDEPVPPASPASSTEVESDDTADDEEAFFDRRSVTSES